MRPIHNCLFSFLQRANTRKPEASSDSRLHFTNCRMANPSSIPFPLDHYNKKHNFSSQFHHLTAKLDCPTPKSNPTQPLDEAPRNPTIETIGHSKSISETRALHQPIDSPMPQSSSQQQLTQKATPHSKPKKNPKCENPRIPFQALHHKDPQTETPRPADDDDGETEARGRDWQAHERGGERGAAGEE
jgi:hypothetical protein